MSSRPIARRGVLGAAAVLCLPAIRRSQADTPVSLISHRYPALEYYADKIKTALPGVAAEVRLMQATDAIQLCRLGLSARSDQLDLVWANSIVLSSFAKSGWLEPLDDLWKKYSAEYKLNDISPSLVKSCMYDGHIYGMPLTVNTTMYAYRTDLYQEKGLKPATTWDGYIENAKQLNAPPRRYGATIAMKGEMIPNELHAVMSTVGDGWFDKDWRPIFNTTRGIEAIETYKRLAKYTVPGFTAVHNDEHTVNLGQDIAAQGQQWATRCASMDNKDKSRVVGKIGWTVMPSGGKQILVGDIYCISKFTAKDKDLLFRMIASALREENQRGAAALAVSSREAVVNDPALIEQYRWYPAIGQALAVGTPMPSLPEFSEASEIIGKRMVQAIVGQTETKTALDTAATEVQTMLRERGYYK